MSLSSTERPPPTRVRVRLFSSMLVKQEMLIIFVYYLDKTQLHRNLVSQKYLKKEADILEHLTLMTLFA